MSELYVRSPETDGPRRSSADAHLAPGRPSAGEASAGSRTEPAETAEPPEPSEPTDESGRRVAGAAHDLNNVLGILAMQLDLLAERVEPDERVDAHLSAMRTAITVGTSLSDSLLPAAELDSPEPEIVNVQDIVDSVAGLMRDAIHPRIRLIVTPAMRFCHAAIAPAELARVLLNVATNAIDAMPSGGELAIETYDQPPAADQVPDRRTVDAGFVVIRLQDTGTGMDPEVLQRAFEWRFSTNVAGNRWHSRTSGLGLATCREIVESHGGHIDVASVPGEGSTFWIRLPVASIGDRDPHRRPWRLPPEEPAGVSTPVSEHSVPGDRPRRKADNPARAGSDHDQGPAFASPPTIPDDPETDRPTRREPLYWAMRRRLPQPARQAVRQAVDRAGSAAVGSVNGRTPHPSGDAPAAVGLTFDDGPHPTVTTQLLDLLEAEEATATFFVLVDRARAYPELVRHMVERGHEVGLHGLAHRRFPSLDPPELARQLNFGRTQLEMLTGHPLRWVRPPFGAQTLRTFYAARRAGLDVVVWNADAEDWVDEDSPAQIADRALDRFKIDGILLLHETTRPEAAASRHEPSRADRAREHEFDLQDPRAADHVQVARLILRGLREQGVRGLSIGDLVEDHKPRRTLWLRP